MEQALLGSMLGRSRFSVQGIRENWIKDQMCDGSFPLRMPVAGGQEILVEGELLMSVEYISSTVRQLLVYVSIRQHTCS